ncbi:hypothetical protein KEM52_006505 [Ascosphaera acerosa]|nr:hypothetical protein KEM52_006505 [Ascosphaera acerosa]
MGPLKQTIFSCLTCNPPPPPTDEQALRAYTPAGVCYACSISCHGDHELAELFTKRDFECDCGTTRIQSVTPCTLRLDATTGEKGGVRNEPARQGNRYNHNFQNRFCGCGEIYNPDDEKGIMFQCLGLGACGEDWWHPECLLGLSRTSSVTAKVEQDGESKAGHSTRDSVADSVEPVEDHDEIPLPEGFPGEDDFEALICYRCIDANPWLKKYAGTTGFLPPVYKRDATAVALDSPDAAQDSSTLSSKRKSEDDHKGSAVVDRQEAKRIKAEESVQRDTPAVPGEGHPETDSVLPPRLHERLPENAPSGTFSLFLKEDFRDHLCHCPSCFPNLAPYPQLLAEEDVYEPPPDSRSASPALSSQLHGGGRTGTSSAHSGGGSLYERGEAALNTMDRVKALEGVMIYQHLRDKVKEFLKPYAERGEAVGAEDVREYFAKLRGDEHAGVNGSRPRASNGDDAAGHDGGGSSRKSQEGF